jgi:predicted ATPase/class 3 adenylate cyclase
MTPTARGAPTSEGSEDNIAGPATFLFTDIEGSTGKWEQEPERMAQAVAAHDALLRGAVEENRGRVIKTSGDGIVAVFPDPVDGIAAVVATQLALTDSALTAGIPLAVRCGLHAGEAQRHGDDYVGTTLNRAARVMALAYGGQVLLSQAVADRLVGRLHEGMALRDLGEVRLKGLAGTERVHQLLHPRLREAFPALRSLEATPNNLPQQLTSFVGREREIEDAEALLARTRLLTLSGIGGLGKTRLALQIAGNVLDRYRDGAWFVDLAPIRDGALVTSEAAKVLGVREEPGRPIVQTLCTNLKTRKLLLILDNCEHLGQACADLAAGILGATTDVQILATSRESLRVPGEQTFAVQPLPVPNRGEGLKELLQSTAVRLFVERARQHKPSFAVDEREAPELAELVARLEGIPLALELAAARVRSLALGEINARLQDRYKLLTGGGRTLLARQQTLRALVDWSYDLLSEPEQVLLQRLSSFAGGCDLHAVEEVCGAEPLAPEDIVDLLASLVEKSLVLPEEGSEDTRYRMLETIRDYARFKLIASGDMDGASSRHCNYYFATAKDGRNGMQGPEQAKWVARLEADHDNMRAAITYSMGGRGDPVIAVKLEVALQAFRLYRGYASEGRNNLRALLAHPAIMSYDLARGHALYVGAVLASEQGDDQEAQRMLETCLGLRRAIGDDVDIAGTLSTLAAVRLRLGDAVRARSGEEEGLAIFRRLGHRSGEAVALQHLGEICAYVGEDVEARRLLGQSLALGCEIKYPEIESDCQRVLGQLALERGDLAEARAFLALALAVCQTGRDKRGTAMVSWWLGKVELASNDGDSALQHLREAIRAFESFGMNAETIGVIEDYARLACSSGVADDSARLYSAASAARERLSLPRAPRLEPLYQNDLGSLRAALTTSAFDIAWRDGREWDLAQAVNRVLALFDATAQRR